MKRKNYSAFRERNVKCIDILRQCDVGYQASVSDAAGTSVIVCGLKIWISVHWNEWLFAVHCTFLFQSF
jgi:hypothetical protein